jgi:hypothetical protein
MTLLLTLGIAILIGTVFQVVTGYAPKLRGSGELIHRKKKRGEFWFMIALEIALSLFCIGLVLNQAGML